MLNLFPSLRFSAKAAALGCLLACAAAPAFAQQPPQSSQATTQIDEQKLQAFANAQKKVEMISQQASERMQAAQSQEESQKIQDQAHRQMAQSVESGGLSVEEYNQIATAAQTDEGLRQKIEELQNRS